MIDQKKLLLSGILVVGAFVQPVKVWGETVDTLGTALEFAGFDLLGNHNPLSGGTDLLISNQFDGSAPFDFGSWNLGLDGPLSLQVSTGGRFISQFDVSLSTALNGSSTPSPLNYAYGYDIGAQSRQVNGSLLADMNFSMNGLGFYDLSVTYSSRQTVETSGLVSNNSATNDADAGPIQISGNIYADALAVITDPFFDRAGRPNFFAGLSGNTILGDILDGSSTGAQSELVSGGSTPGATLFRTTTLGFGNGTLPPGNGNGRGNGNGNGNGNASGGAVPEPTVLVLLLLGVPAILSRTRRP